MALDLTTNAQAKLDQVNLSTQLIVKIELVILYRLHSRNYENFYEKYIEIISNSMKLDLRY